MFLNGVVGKLLHGIWLWLFAIPWTVACQAPLSMEFQTIDWFDLLQSKGFSRVLQLHSSKVSSLWRSAFFMVQLSYPYKTTGKTIALTRQTFFSKVMSLLFNILSRLVITFLPRSKRLWISWLQLPSAVILEPKKVKSVTVSTVSPSIVPWSDGTRCHDLCFLNVEF